MHHHQIIVCLDVVSFSFLSREEWKVLNRSSSCCFSFHFIIQFWFDFIPVNRGGQIYSTLTAISPTPTVHLARFMASSFSKPTLFLSFSACLFHVFFGCPCFLFPFTSNYNAFLKTCHHPPSTHARTISLHLPLPLLQCRLKILLFETSGSTLKGGNI